MAYSPLAGVQRHAGDGQNVRKRASLTPVLHLVLETAKSINLSLTPFLTDC